MGASPFVNRPSLIDLLSQGHRWFLATPGITLAAYMIYRLTPYFFMRTHLLTLQHIFSSPFAPAYWAGWSISSDLIFRAALSY